MVLQRREDTPKPGEKAAESGWGREGAATSEGGSEGGKEAERELPKRCHFPLRVIIPEPSLASYHFALLNVGVPGLVNEAVKQRQRKAWEARPWQSQSPNTWKGLLYLPSGVASLHHFQQMNRAKGIKEPHLSRHSHNKAQ